MNDSLRNLLYEMKNYWDEIDRINKESEKNFYDPCSEGEAARREEIKVLEDRVTRAWGAMFDHYRPTF